jgi:hypothetical protein
VHNDGSQTRPKRISLNKHSFVEGWPQELIRNNPELLPVAEIDGDFAPLVAIGREVQIPVGMIDIMFMSPGGYLTIVETKLWRNHEARREVVAQIIDYAKDVSHWTFQELEDRVRKYNQEYRKSDLGLLDTLRLAEQIDEEDERFLIDKISRNLRQGRFLLLIAGDGIRESVEEMVEFLQRYPQLLFTLALVELQVHELDTAGNRLVVPQIVARTREITRAVVKIDDKAIESIHVAGMDTDVNWDERKPRQKYTLPADAFFELLTESVGKEDADFAKQILDDMERHDYTIKWRKSSFMVWLPDPGGSGENLTLFGIKAEGKAFVGWLPRKLRELNLPESIALDFVKDSARLFRNEVSPKDPGGWKRNISLGELREKYTEFKSLLERTVDRIVQASNRSEEEPSSEGKG